MWIANHGATDAETRLRRQLGFRAIGWPREQRRKYLDLRGIVDIGHKALADTLFVDVALG